MPFVIENRGWILKHNLTSVIFSIFTGLKRHLAALTPTNSLKLNEKLVCSSLFQNMNILCYNQVKHHKKLRVQQQNTETSTLLSIVIRSGNYGGVILKNYYSKKKYIKYKYVIFAVTYKSISSQCVSSPHPHSSIIKVIFFLDFSHLYGLLSIRYKHIIAGLPTFAFLSSVMMQSSRKCCKDKTQELKQKQFAVKW